MKRFCGPYSWDILYVCHIICFSRLGEWRCLQIYMGDSITVTASVWVWCQIIYMGDISGWKYLQIIHGGVWCRFNKIAPMRQPMKNFIYDKARTSSRLLPLGANKHGRKIRQCSSHGTVVLLVMSQNETAIQTSVEIFQNIPTSREQIYLQ